MDNKFFVSLEAARLLKEKGYNEECNATIDDDGELFDEKYLTNQDLPKWRWSCPTKAEAIDWLESKGIVLCVYLLDLSKWGYTIINHKDKHIFGDFFEDKNRLETEEAAIIKALEIL